MTLTETTAACADATRLAVRRVGTPAAPAWELVGVDSRGLLVAKCTGAELVGTVVTFGRKKMVVDVIITRVGLLPSGNIGYVFVRRDYEALSGLENEWPSLCSVAESMAVRSALGLKPWPASQAKQQPNVTQSQAMRPRPHLRSSIKTIEETEPLTTAEIGEAVVIVPGAVFDGTGEARIAPKPHKNQNWYNLACVGDSLAKVALRDRIAYFDPATTNAQRSAAVRAETAIYCEGDPARPWRSRTVRGIEIALAANLPPAQGMTREGMWDEKGLLCIDEPRVFAPNRITPRDVLPALCGATNCADPVVYRDALDQECNPDPAHPVRSIGPCTTYQGPSLFTSAWR